MKTRVFAAVLGGAMMMTVTAPSFAEDAKADNPVVAVVNNVKIYKDEVVDARFLLPQQYQNLPLNIVYPQLLDSLIDRTLMAAAGRKEGLADDPEVKKQMARIEEQLVQRAFLGKHITASMSDDKLRVAYDVFKANNIMEDEVHARHILVETEEQAKEIIKAIEGGKDFAELAKEKSKGPSGKTGGDLGYFKADAMVPAFSKAAFSLGKSGVTKEAVQTQFGWHVIKVEDRRRIEPPSFEEAKPQIEAQVSREIATVIVQKLRDEASIERFDLEGKPIPAPEAKPAEK